MNVYDRSIKEIKTYKFEQGNITVKQANTLVMHERKAHFITIQ